VSLSHLRVARLEDFTSLLWTVSAGRRPPPEVASLHAPPFQVGGHQPDQRLEVTTNRRVQSVLHPLGVTHGSMIAHPITSFRGNYRRGCSSQRP
jgi:hypothetical protein